MLRGAQARRMAEPKRMSSLQAAGAPALSTWVAANVRTWTFVEGVAVAFVVGVVTKRLMTKRLVTAQVLLDVQRILPRMISTRMACLLLLHHAALLVPLPSLPLRLLRLPL
mgnify:CR=1 FL=1